MQVIRGGDWKLIEEGASYYQWPEQPLQLYNIRQDPYEKQNQAAQHPEIVVRLRDRLAWHRRFAREEEPPERILGDRPAVYGEEENAKYGPWVREEAAKLKLREHDAKAQQRERQRRKKR